MSEVVENLLFVRLFLSVAKESAPNDVVTRWASLRSQIVISKGRGGKRTLPHAYTEHGAILAANLSDLVQLFSG
jgi:hypothetical protein